MYKFYLSKVPSGCKSVPLFYVQYATGMRILYCLYKVQPFLTLCAISKLRAHENLDTPEHMTNCKAHGRNSHLYHLLYLDAGWHFWSNKECHLWLKSSPSKSSSRNFHPRRRFQPTGWSSCISCPCLGHAHRTAVCPSKGMSDITLVWMFLARLVFKVYESKHAKCQMFEFLFFLARFKTPEWKMSQYLSIQKAAPPKLEGPPQPIKASGFCLKNHP